jgi:hypothetical protein
VLARGRVHRLASLAEADSEARLLRRQPRSSVIAASQQGAQTPRSPRSRKAYQLAPARCSTVPTEEVHI